MKLEARKIRNMKNLKPGTWDMEGRQWKTRTKHKDMTKTQRKRVRHKGRINRDMSEEPDKHKGHDRHTGDTGMRQRLKRNLTNKKP